MPVDRKRYPPNWASEIRPRILARAGEVRNDGVIDQQARCEWCGAENGATGHRDVRTGAFRECATCRDAAGGPADCPNGRPLRIVLTIAHLGTAHPDGRPGDKHDKMDCRPENLAALCQRCHLRFDGDEHALNSARTRIRKKLAAGQLPFDV